MPCESDVPSAASMPLKQRFQVGPSSGDHQSGEHRHDGGRNREGAKDAKPEVRERQADHRGERSDADDHRGAHQVGDPLERDRGGGVARADAIGEQHTLSGSPAMPRSVR